MSSYLGDLLEATPPSLQWTLMGIGALIVGKKTYEFFQFVLQVFLLSGVDLRRYGKPGTWAIVTGASDGLGKEFALQMAKKGFNLVLVSRTQSKLEALAREIEESFSGNNIQTRIVAMDYTQDKDEDYRKLATIIADLDVGILINNVGRSHSIPVPFLETDRQELQNIVVINCLGTLKTTQVVAPMMVKRGRGLILTMGSFAGWLPTPYLATYGGSKAFLQQWSESLASELKPHGVDVQLVLSYLVTTAMSKVRRASLMIPSPRPFVRVALSKIGNGGFQSASNTYTPWWSHALMLFVIEKTLGASNPVAIWVNKKMHMDIRTRALKKAARMVKEE